MSPAKRARKPVHVVAAAVTDAEGRVLIAQRPPGKHLAGSWEFPGGKVEPGEIRVEALARELREELGISLTGHPRPLMRLTHSYPFGDVLIDMWVVARYSGEPTGLDGQALRWCAWAELGGAELLAADRPIVRTLCLPALLSRSISTGYAVGDAGIDGALRGVAITTPAAGLSAAHADRADFLVLRTEIPDDQLVALCDTVTIPVYCRNRSVEDAWMLGATGVSAL